MFQIYSGKKGDTMIETDTGSNSLQGGQSNKREGPVNKNNNQMQEA